MHLEKTRTYACTFPVQRKEINVVKVRFTMRYSSRKLSHEKLITTACNFWDKLLVLSCLRVKRFIIRQQNFWNPASFSNPARGSGQKSSRLLITFSRPEIPTLVAQISISFAVLAIIRETPDFGAYLLGSRLTVWNHPDNRQSLPFLR